jgi:glucokinase
MGNESAESRTGLAVDLGGTSVKVGVVDSDGAVLAQEQIPTQTYEGPERVLERVAEAAIEAREAVGGQPVAVGIGAPGLVDVRRGIGRFLPNLGKEWAGFPIGDFLQARLGCPARLLNDVRTATLGELTFGHGKGRVGLTMAFFALGTGIGGGVVVDGRLRLGPDGAAGELGHMVVEPDGRRCGCGNSGCLEAYASAPALTGEGCRLLHSGQAPILYDIVGGDPGKIDPKTMSEAAKAGDKAVREAIEWAAGYLAIGVGNVVVALHPELIVLGGGMAGIGDLLFDVVRERVQRLDALVPMENVRIEPSALGDRAGLLGAGALALHGLEGQDD